MSAVDMLTFFKKGDRSSPFGPRTYSVHLCVQYSVACSRNRCNEPELHHGASSNSMSWR